MAHFLTSKWVDFCNIVSYKFTKINKILWWNVVSMIHSRPTNKEEWNAIGLKGASHVKMATALQTLSD